MSQPAPHRPSALLAVGGALLLALPWIYVGYASNDEYEMLANGVRTATGQLQYRDYFYAEPPLSHWLLALPYLVAGPSILAARWLQTVLLVLAAWQAYRLARWAGATPWLAVLPAWLLLGACYVRNPGINHHWLVLPIALASLLAGLRAGQDGRPRAWAVAGALAGLTMMTLQTDGAVVLVALVAAALVGGWWVGEAGPRILRQLGALLAGFAVPVALVAGVLAALGTLPLAIESVLWPLHHYRVAGGINDIRFLTDLYPKVPPMADTPFARPSWYLALFGFLALAGLPAFAALGGTAWGISVCLLRLGGRLAGPAARSLGLVAIAALGYWLLSQAGRADLEHLAMYATPSFALAAAAASAAWTRATPEWRLAGALPTLALALLLGSGLAFGMTALTLQPYYLWSGRGPDQRAREDATMAYLHAHARPGDRLIAVPAGGYYYYYAGLVPAARWTSVYDRASHFMADQELDAFWRDVAASGARFLVVDPSNEPFMRDAFPGPPPGYHVAFTAPSVRYIGPWVTLYERDDGGKPGHL